MEYKPLRFIGESIDAVFDTDPVLEKKPGCPNAFTWRGDSFRIKEIISEWYDYRRRGRLARNMQLGHPATAERRGSWGVGEFYYRVRTEGERIFDIYYDRSSKDVDHRKGEWFLYRELSIFVIQNDNPPT
jgi:hypothetical protein